ncbi:PIR protein [Plasmodium vivax]|uniref:VIR protein n=1 Tax=Plasmodium vivax TaxID=5855 RepID=A0A565A6Y4_PLAVI|nr:PIR protein [Plasmodium vivax]
MIPICQKYLRFLYTSNEWSKLFSEFDISLLLNYWLYDKVTQIFNAKNTDKINFAFSDLQMVWSNFNNNRIEKTYYDKCRPEPKLVNHEDWENRKKLYDFYVDFNTLFRTGTIYDDVCDEYYQKIKEMIPVCKDFQVKCSTPETYKCPAEYNKCEERDLDFALEQLPCHHKFKGTTVSSSEDGSFPRSTGSEGRIQDPAAEAGTQSESGNAGIREKVTNSVLGATPALLTATMLYRYTPLGPWIRRFGGGRTNNMGAMDTFSHYAPETGEMFSDDPANYISYQPM